MLKQATEEADNPDLRDRAYIYWRMLSTSPQNAKLVVLGEKPSMADDSYNQYDDSLVSALIDSISTLGSVYHKSAEDLVAMQRKAAGLTPLVKKEEEEPAEEEAKEPPKKEKPKMDTKIDAKVEPAKKPKKTS